MSPHTEGSSTRLELPAPTHSSLREFRGIAVRFAVASLHPSRVTLCSGREELPLTLSNGVWRGTWGTPLEAAFELVVECHAAPPPVTDVYWSREQAPAGVLVAGDQQSPPPRESIGLAEALAPIELICRGQARERQRVPPLNFRHADWIVERLDDVAGSIESNIFALRRRAFRQELRSRQFFLEMDALRTGEPVQGFSPEEQQEFAEAIVHVQYRLSYRLSLRAGMAPLGLQPVFPPDPLRQLKAVSSAFVKLHRQHLAAEEASDSADDPRDLWDFAFEQFATDRGGAFHGDPRSQAILLRQGQPDGEYFLCFAELALLCVDEDCDADFWRPKLLSTVRASHMFAEHRAPEGWFSEESPTHAEGSVPFGYREGRAFPRRRRAELHADYSRCDHRSLSDSDRDWLLRSRFTQIAGSVLCDSTAFPPGQFSEEDLRNEPHRQLLSLRPGGDSGARARTP